MEVCICIEMLYCTFSLFKRIHFTTEMFQHRGFTRLKQLEYLLKTGQIDPDFFWTKTDFLD